MLRTRYATALAAVLAGFAVSLVTPAAPAQAANCQSNRLCVWTDPNYNGHMRAIQYTNANWHEVAPDIADLDSSWFNNTSQGAHVYHDVSCEGYYLTLHIGEALNGSRWYDNEGSANIMGSNANGC